MTKSQAIKNNTQYAHSNVLSWEESVVANSEENGDSNNLSELNIDNNHHLFIQPMLPLEITSQILSSLTNISEANIFVLSEAFKDLNKDFLKSPTIK